MKRLPPEARGTRQARRKSGWPHVSISLFCALTSRVGLAEPAAHTNPEAQEAAPAPVIEPPRKLSDMEVEYPSGETAEAAVVLELLIGKSGRVEDATLVAGEAPFDAAALSAASTWRFSAARRDGEPVPVRIRMEVLFTPPIVEVGAQEEAAAPAPPQKPSSPEDELEAENSVPEPDEVLNVTVEGERTVGVKRLGRAEVRQMPGAFGDPYRAIEALPGVTPIASGLPYFFVRGAPPGNVGYFFDDVAVPLLYHVAAGPGVIHPAFVESVDLYSGAYPARYGRYAGGIVAGEAAEPEGRFRGETSIRLVDAGALLEVPFSEGRGNMMLAGRYSYTGLIVSLLAPEVTLGYWDYQGRINYDLGPRDRLSLFSFGAHDFLEANDDNGQKQEILDLTFHRLKGRYTRELSSDANMSAALTFGLERTGLGGDPDSSEEDPADLRTRTLGAQFRYENRLSSTFLFRGGADTEWSRMNLNINTDRQDDDDSGEDSSTPPSLEELQDQRQNETLPTPGFPGIVLEPLDILEDQERDETLEERFAFSRDDVVAGLWLESVWKIAPGVTLTPGFRLDLYDTGGDIALAPEPRIAARFDITEGVSLTHDLGLAHQPPSFVVPIPGLDGAANDGLQQAIQSSASVEVKLPLKFTASATLFQNVILNSTDVLSTIRLQRSDPTADGFTDRTTNHSYGLELYLRRSLAEKLGGFIAYTIARSTRSISRASGISSFDRSHVINAALAYDLGRRWRLGSRLVAYSGIPAEVAYAEAAVSPPRTPWFYRLDWRLEKRWLIGNSGAWWALVFEALNTTLNKEILRSSCYAYGCEEREIGPVTIPSIGVEASF